MGISNFKFQISKWAGQTLIELILIIGITAIILPALLTGFVASRNGKPQQQQRVQAVTILKETESALKNIKNSNWTALSVNGTYHTEISGTQWALVPGTFTNPGRIKQEVIISNVMRDENGAIVSTGGTADPSTKKIDINISWTLPYLSSINSTMYLTRTKNEAFTQTTQSDFNAGTNAGTTVVATGTSPTDGQVELATTGEGGGGGRPLSDWCKPNLSITALDLPKNGVANAISAIEGRVFAGTGENSSGVSFANVNVTNTNPPNSSIAGTFNGYKTNDIFGETNYAYLATDTNSKEIMIVNLTTNPYGEAGYFNAPGNSSGNSVFVSGNIGYVTAGAFLYTFDLSSKTGSRPQLGAVALAGTGNDVYVVGDYAYVATQGTPVRMQVVDVSNPSSLGIVATVNISVSQLSKGVYVNSTGTRAYLAASSSQSGPEFYIIDTTTKSGILPILGTYETNGMSPNGITAVIQNYKAILVGTGAEEYQVIDISNEASPTHCGGLNIDTGVKGVSSVVEADGDAYSYIVTGDASAELKIIEGGPGGTTANWCMPQDAIRNTLTLPKQGKVITAKEGEAFVASGDGVSGVEFADIAISTPAPPNNPSSSIISTFSGNDRTNDVFSDGNYAYLAVNGSTSQVLILNITGSSFTKIGTINIPNSGGANGVYVVNNIAYVTSGDKLYAFNVTTKTGAHNTVLGESAMYSEDGVTPVAKKVKVVGGKAFVGAANTAYGLQVFLIGSGGSSLRLVGVSDLDFSQSATGISVNATGSRGYVSFNNGTGSVSKGFFAVNTSVDDPPNWWPLPNFYTIISTYNSGETDPTGISIADGTSNRLILTGTGGAKQYHAIDISVEADPLLCGGLEIAEGVKGVSSIKDQFNRGYSYIITGEASNQFKIIQGGSGGGNHTEDGVFESSIFSAGSNNAAFNRFVATINKPEQTTLRMQVAAGPAVGGSCSGATYTYVGPDGSSTSFFNPGGGTISSPIPFGSYSPGFENPAQCFRYKTFFTTWNTAQTPTFNDITINYSP